MEKSLLLLLLQILTFAIANAQSVYTCNGTNVNVRSSNCTSAASFGQVSNPHSFVVIGTTGNNCGYNWYMIDIPNAHGQSGYPTIAYVATNYYSLSSSPTNYLTVQNAPSGLLIKNSAGGTQTWIYNSGYNFNYASFENGQRLARTSSSPIQISGNTWYEVYLMPNCYAGSSTSSGQVLVGWVSDGMNNGGPYVVPYGCSTPAAPTNLTVTSISSSSIGLSWTLVSGSGITYEILKNNTSCGYVFGSSGFTSSNSNISITGLASNTTYYFVVIASNSCGTSNNSNCAYATTQSNGTAPVANFSASTTSGTAPLLVYFSDISSNSPTSWSWDFGDGSYSSQQNPSHSYSSAGTYSVSLTVSNSYGNNTMTKSSYISVTSSGSAPNSNFYATPITVNTGGSINFYDLSNNNPTSWYWSFQGGTPYSSTAQNPVIIYNSPGTYDVTLTATNNYGSNTVTFNSYITVNSSSYSISGNVKSAYINNSGGQIGLNSIAGCSVTIYNTGTLNAIQTVYTNSSGQFTFSGLANGIYDIEASHSFAGTFYAAKETGINVNSSNTVLKFPFQIIENLRNYNDSLSQLYCYIDEVGQNFPIPSYDVSNSNYYLTNISILNNDDQIIESLGRLYIAEKNLYQYFKQTDIINNEYVADILFFSKSFFDLFAVAAFSQNTIVQNIVSGMVDVIKDLFEISLNQFPSQERHNLQTFFDVQIDYMNLLVYNITPTPSTFINILSVPLSADLSNRIAGTNTSATQNTFNNSVAYATSNLYSGTFNSHFVQVQNSLFSSQAQTAYSQAYAESLRNNAVVGNYMADIINLFNSAMGGSVPILNLIGIAANTYPLIVLGFSMSECSHRLKDIRYEINQTIPQAFFKDTQNGWNIYNSNQIQILNTDSAINKFNAELSNTMNDINSNNVSNYGNRLSTLINLNNELNFALRDEIFHFKAAMPYCGIQKIDSILVSNLKNTLLISHSYRAAFILGLDGLINTPNDNSLKDSITSYGNKIFISNDSIPDELANFNSLFSGTYIPPFIVVSENNFPEKIQPNQSIPIVLKFKNYSSTNATNVYVKFVTDGIYSISPDSVYIGNIASGQSDSITVQLISTGIDTIGTYSIDFGGTNIDYIASGGAIAVSKDAISTLLENRISDFTCYPNPSSGKFIIQSNGKSPFLVKVTNPLGQIVYNSKVLLPNSEINLSGIPFGIYFLEIQMENKLYSQKLIISDPNIK